MLKKSLLAPWRGGLGSRAAREETEGLDDYKATVEIQGTAAMTTTPITSAAR
jgi:hypothetical protein